MLRLVIVSVFFLSVLCGCGRGTSLQGGDVPSTASTGHEDYLVYGDNACIVANGMFMRRSGSSLTIYGDASCPHAAFQECAGPTIGTLAVGGSLDDCGTTYSLTEESDSTTDYLRVRLTYH